jgi:hypothetical protein
MTHGFKFGWGFHIVRHILTLVIQLWKIRQSTRLFYSVAGNDGWLEEQFFATIA